jgi:hypothetical protein
MEVNDKKVVWLHGEIKTPPFSTAVRMEAGFLLRQLQYGVKLSMPQAYADNWEAMPRASDHRQ